MRLPRGVAVCGVFVSQEIASRDTKMLRGITLQQIERMLPGYPAADGKVCEQTSFYERGERKYV